MKSAFALLAAVFVFAGCSPSENASATEPKPDASSPTTATSTGTPDTTQVKPPAFDGNPNRRFQLKDLAVREIKANGHKLKVWLMDNDPKREEGMMWLKDPDVKDDEGMLFVFPEDQPADNQHGFWMHNTILPLDIIYITKEGKVANIQEGKPFDETSLPAKSAYLYTLELKAGQAKKLAIKPGTKVEIPSDIKTIE